MDSFFLSRTVQVSIEESRVKCTLVLVADGPHDSFDERTNMYLHSSGHFLLLYIDILY